MLGRLNRRRVRQLRGAAGLPKSERIPNPLIFNIASAAMLGAYVALLAAGTVAHYRERYDAYVHLNVAALGFVISNTVASFLWGESRIALFIWAVNSAIQGVNVMQARKYRRRWQLTPHVCNEDCPGWIGWKESVQ